MAVDVTGVYQYSPNDTVNSWHNMLNLGMSSVATVARDLYKYSAVTAPDYSTALQRCRAINAKGVVVSQSQPLLVYRTDTKWFSTYDGSSLRELDKPDPRDTVIDGKAYRRSGVVNVGMFNFPYSTNPVYCATISITPPYKPPKGWTFNFMTEETTSFTFVQRGSYESRTNTYLCRVVQLYASTQGALTKIRWILVPE